MPTGYSNHMNTANQARQIIADMVEQGGRVKGGVRTRHQGRVKVITEGQIIEGQGINEGQVVIEGRGRCHASQTSRYSLGVRPRCNVTPACPHDKAGRRMN